MEISQLKNYGPQARRGFIEGVKNRAAVYGLLPKEILPMTEEGDVVVIGDRPFPRSVAKQRKQLEERVHREGFEQFIESVAYTWFNRFVAIRFMELHGYLDHSYRVLSHPEGNSTPEILENTERIELPGLDKDKTIELKLDGTKDEELCMIEIKRANDPQYLKLKEKGGPEIEKFYVRSGNSSIELPMKDIAPYIQSRFN